MQYGATGKMSPATDQRHVREELLSLSIPKLNRWIRTHNPAVVSGMKVDRDTAECAAPFHHRGIEVRMRDGDCLQAAKTIDQGNGRRVQHRNAVPQDISMGVQTTSARWPIAKAGCVPMPITPGSYWRYELKCPAASAANVVQVCPRGGTYCRSSSQVRHSSGATLLGVYWVPQAVQINASI
jgi:hypothetical protein